MAQVDEFGEYQSSNHEDAAVDAAEGRGSGSAKRARPTKPPATRRSSRPERADLGNYQPFEQLAFHLLRPIAHHLFLTWLVRMDFPIRADGFSSLAHHSVTDIVELDGNSGCVDCGAQGAEWASVSFGVCVCTKYVLRIFSGLRFACPTSRLFWSMVRPDVAAVIVD